MANRYNEFLTGMNAVYDRFRNNGPEISGTKVGAIVTKEHNLYALVMRYDGRVNEHVARVSERVSNEHVARVSERVSEVVPALRYREEVIHTTVLDTVPDTPRDKSLEGILSTLGGMYFRDLRVDIGKPLSNSDSVILPGVPTESFVGLSDELARSVERFYPNSLPRIKKPWGSHLTASRYLEVRDQEISDEIQKILREFPALGTVKPVALEVWEASIGPGGFSKNILSQTKF